MDTSSRYLFAAVCAVLVLAFGALVFYACAPGVPGAGSFFLMGDAASVLQGRHETRALYPEVFLEDAPALSARPFVQNVTAVYFAAALAKLFGVYGGWVVLGAFSTLLCAALLFLILRRTTRVWTALLLSALYLSLPGLFYSVARVSYQPVSACLLMLFLYVYYLDTPYLLKWYVLSLLSGLLYIDHAVCILILAAVPFLAAFHIKRQHSTWTAASHAFLLLLLSSGLVWFGRHFFADYASTLQAPFRAPAGISAVVSLFYPFSYKTVLVLIPFFLMGALSIAGLFGTARYLKRYMWPAVGCLALFFFGTYRYGGGENLAVILYPAVFLGGASALAHKRMFRKAERGVLSCLAAATVVMFAINGGCATYVRREGSACASYMEAFSEEYAKNIPANASVLVVCGPQHYAVQSYLLAPRVAMFSPPEREFLQNVINIGRPDYIVSPLDSPPIGYAAVDQFLSDQDGAYTLYKGNQPLSR